MKLKQFLSPIKDLNEAGNSYSTVAVSKPYLTINDKYYIQLSTYLTINDKYYIQLNSHEPRMCKNLLIINIYVRNYYWLNIDLNTTMRV